MSERPVPPHVTREVERILDEVAREKGERHLNHIARTIKEDPDCGVCRDRRQTDGQFVRP